MTRSREHYIQIISHLLFVWWHANAEQLSNRDTAVDTFSIRPQKPDVFNNTSADLASQLGMTEQR